MVSRVTLTVALTLLIGKDTAEIIFHPSSYLLFSLISSALRWQV